MLDGLSQKLRNTLSLISLRGYRRTLVRIFEKLLGLESEIIEIKTSINRRIGISTGFVVQEGLFTGMQISSDPWWGRFDIASKALGRYEHHIQKVLEQVVSTRSVDFVDIGAADGYFAIGMALQKNVKHVHAFEMSHKGRERLNLMINKNGCSAKCSIYGHASSEGIINCLGATRVGVVLIDIEGGEYDLLTKALLNFLSSCWIIVELHPWVVSSEKSEEFLNNISTYHDVRFLTRESYDPDQISVLFGLNDDQRLLALSEGRGKRMEWAYLCPREID